jgi:hypothetical protein
MVPASQLRPSLDHTHAAGTDFLDDAVMRDGFANHVDGKGWA